MSESVPHISVNNLTFRYNADQRPILNNLNLQLTNGARCLLIGANGAGLILSSFLLFFLFFSCFLVVFFIHYLNICLFLIDRKINFT